ncbi:TetR/AcrR family transcriptional regulator [Litorivivens sp.]|uniref:TetR/AcrR family transcriptional regulator n=1 Tax=Litorivivens sp. TaxID=2020868 RepID=UPI003563CA56
MATSRRWGRGARVDDLDTGRKKLLQAAITCFVSKGIQATTIEDIANAANVTRRTVYRYYAGKSELLEAVVELERKRLFERMHQAAEPYHQDFPRMLEECLASAAQLLSPNMGAPDLISEQNAASAIPHMLGEESLAEWHGLLEEPYANYRRDHGDIGSLEQIIDVLGRLVLSFRYLPCSADDIRRAMDAFLTLSRRKPSSLRLV